jgi:hypothetical protein
MSRLGNGAVISWLLVGWKGLWPELALPGVEHDIAALRSRAALGRVLWCGIFRCFQRCSLTNLQQCCLAMSLPWPVQLDRRQAARGCNCRSVLIHAKEGSKAAEPPPGRYGTRALLRPLDRDQFPRIHASLFDRIARNVCYLHHSPQSTSRA